jgi:23S rRNA pseudouridine2604 synthase
MPEEEPVRLSKRMAELGLCSRREADEFISRGLVLVDGVPQNTLGVKVLPSQSITLHPSAAKEQTQLATFLLNKPIGYVSGQPEDDHPPAVVLITPGNRHAECTGPRFKSSMREGLAPAGRLDIDSKGLLVFTQDGRLARRLTGEEHSLEKEYLVRVKGQLPESGLRRLRHGLVLDGKPLLPAEVDWMNRDQLRFVIREGRKRQIRRMCEAVGLIVVGLKRVRIGRIALGKLPEGRWRFLLPGESF